MRRTDPASFDALVEHAGRWTAARSTRRSFLGRVGKVAVMVASGPAIAALIAERADARVCGQSGVSPKCPTFDCDDQWGWCWYSNGCCADGLLKKICDCCVLNYPNVHGYCPSGRNVKCIVESCGADPRLQTVALHRLITDDTVAVALAAAQARYPVGTGDAVLADAADPLSAAVAAPVAGVLGGSLFAVARAPASAGLLAALRTLATQRVTIVGASLPTSLDTSITNAGFTVTRVGTAPDIGPFSGQVATWVREVNGSAGTVCIVPAGTSAAAAPLAGNYAAGLGWPLLIGVDQAALALVNTFLVGPEAAAHQGELPGSSATTTATTSTIAVELASRALAAGGAATTRIVVTSRTAPVLHVLAAFGAPVVLHEPGTLDGAREWLYSRQATYGRAASAYSVGATGALGDSSVLELQSILNDYETRLLIGVSGEGLPVIPQPLDERCIGCARVGPSTKEAQKAPPTYWGERVVRAADGP